MLKDNNFPPYLYRAFTKKKYAVDFIYRGKFRLGLIDNYRLIEDSMRRDETERESSYFINFETGLSHVSGTILGALYLICTSGPKVELNHLGSFGRFIVKINDPRQLLNDIRNGRPVNSGINLIGKVMLQKVSYTKNQEGSIDPDSIDAVRLDYRQKPPSFSEDDEFRFVVFTSQELNDETEKYLYYDLSRTLKYIELL